MSLEINKIYNCDCLELMKQMQDNFVDLTITSPPYDKLRLYNGYDFDFESIAKELFRVTKVGGVVVWVVGDSTVNGSETLTSFKQAIYFKEVCGFNVHDTMIYAKKGCPFPESNRYNQCWEYCFVLSKGKPKTTNLLQQKTLYTQAQLHKQNKASTRQADGTLTPKKYAVNKEFTTRFNIWNYATGNGKSTLDNIAFEHPATFPEKLVADHIYSWSNKNDIVFDPMGGSGTVPKMCHLMKRNWIMSEISAEYCILAERRIKPYLQQQQIPFT